MGLISRVSRRTYRTKMIPEFVLKSSQKFPALVLGTYKITENTCQTIKQAINVGYKNIDTAKMYKNEAGIGDAISSSENPRENLFITTKLASNEAQPHQVIPALKTQLLDLKVDYVDLYLIHAPWVVDENDKVLDVDLIKVWEEMEECVNLGLTKSIGVSNFNENQVEKLVKQCKKHQPVVNQVECHPWFNQENLINHHRQLGVHVSAYCPIGRGARIKNPKNPGLELLNDPVILEIAESYKTSPAHVCILFQVQRGVSAVVKAASEKNQKANLEEFGKNIVLSGKDIFRLMDLEQHRSLPFED